MLLYLPVSSEVGWHADLLITLTDDYGKHRMPEVP